LKYPKKKKVQIGRQQLQLSNMSFEQRRDNRPPLLRLPLQSTVLGAFEHLMEL
jgi:hypothetical protein